MPGKDRKEMARRIIIYLIVVFVAVFTLFHSIDDTQNPVKKNQPTQVFEEVKIRDKTDSLLQLYDKIISRKIDDSHITGAAIAVVINGETKLIHCFGEREAGTGKPVTPATAFRLASVSKTLSGTLAGILNKDGILPLDTRIKDYLPGFRLQDSLSSQNLNLEHILSHTSGLVPHAYDNMVEGDVELGIIIDSLSRVQTSAPPGQLYGYQNVVFSIFDTLTVLATGKSFGTVMEEKLFKPLEMKNASVGGEGFLRNANIAYPHTSYGRVHRNELNTKGYYITAPAAGINASISDLTLFLKALLGHNSYLDSATISNIISPRVLSPLRYHYLRKWKSVESKHYALGWRIIGSYGESIAYHGGYIRGYRSEIAFCREKDFGIVFLSNSPNAVGSQIVPLFLDMYLGGNSEFTK